MNCFPEHIVNQSAILLLVPLRAPTHTRQTVLALTGQGMLERSPQVNAPPETRFHRKLLC